MEVLNNCKCCWNKLQKQLKDMLLKDLSLHEVKTMVSDFIFQIILIKNKQTNKQIKTTTEIIYDFICSKTIRRIISIINMLDFCLLHYLCSSDSETMTLHLIHHFLKLLTTTTKKLK